MDKLNNSNQKNLRVLNIFAYTGCATMAAASSDNVSDVVHVDASKSINDWAKENMHLCKLFRYGSGTGWNRSSGKRL